MGRPTYLARGAAAVRLEGNLVAVRRGCVLLLLLRAGLWLCAYSSMLKVTTFSKESSPALTIATRCWYVGMGVEPVGRPSTKGLSAVGANARMRSRTRPATNSPHSVWAGEHWASAQQRQRR